MFDAQVTVIYHPADEAFAGRLIKTISAHQLKALGYAVDESQDSDLFRAATIAVVWSRSSASYLNLRSSAMRAKKRGAAVTVVQIDETPLPTLFSSATIITLAGWHGELQHPGLQALLSIWPERVVPSKLGRGLSCNGYPMLELRDSVSVFISHATPDKPRIRPLVIELLESGFSVWIDNPQDLDLPPEYYARVEETRIGAGKDWENEIKGALASCDWVLGVWSNHALDGGREHFHREIFTAIRQDKLHQCAIDAVIDAVLPPWPYGFFQVVDLSRYAPEQLSVNLQDLIKALAADSTKAWIEA